MKIRATLSIGYYNANREDIIEIPDEELEGLNEDERELAILEAIEYWSNEYIELGWEEVEEDEN